jgi:hypothetical protein
MRFIKENEKNDGVSLACLQVNGKNGFGNAGFTPFIVKLTMEERIF